MIAVLIILILTVVQFLSGSGLLTLCRIQLKPALFIPLSLIMGVAVFSIVPFILQLFYIPLTAANVFISLGFVCIVLNVKFKKSIQQFVDALRKSRFRIRLYEIPFLAIICFIIFVSAWRCFYYPPTPRDLTSGAEVIAEYAVREHTMINSAFTVNLEMNNNPFKPPFITCLQLIYKLAGFSFGQIWLTTLFISFIIFLYHAISATVHRLLSGFLILFFLAIPEMYAYTFMVLFDYSNSVFFFLSIWFLILYTDSRKLEHLVFAGLLMGIATYIRSETLVLAVLTAPFLLWHYIKNKDSIAAQALGIIMFLLPSLLLYVVPISIYINFYIPVKYSIPDNINPHLMNPAPLFQRFSEMNSRLIFSASGITRYGYFISLFVFVFVVDSIYNRGISSQARKWLYAVLVIYLGVPFLGYLLPLLDLDNSTKRALFKIFPLMLLYMANSGMLMEVSGKISKWESPRTIIV